ncbi:hypothetical protein D3C81_2092920 [compost metagenome]
MIGKRSIRRISIALPNRINGMVMTMPTKSRPIWPFAAPAMPSTLSRLITMSAMMMVLTAPQKLSLAFSSAFSSSGISNLIPIHSSRIAPTTST